MSLRNKLDDFFNPVPSNKQQKADLEDPVDIYSHVGKFFKKDAKTDAYAEQVEIGTRRIHGDIEQDTNVKKVSRKELINMQSSEDDYDEEMGGSDDEEITSVEDMEESEEAMEESGDNSEEPSVEKKS